ncbi:MULTISPECIES: BPSS1780 family membrane protein [Paraburkholderia]|jgi:hypothetical protein|uniref:DUF2189 domain-containing protein n=1 Tax=Paraburkholderia phenazinium TaxID=60549 RepID=A0A1N6GWW8_9BURK|nr:BPSS1780 family membrane protein [Paraburkholderia phenazinium]SIO11937.1 hypothetical protein SAMN05444168_2758 [Paraburkholderia phenazinium]
MNIDYPSDVSKQTRLHRAPALPFSGGREVNPLHIADWLVSGVRALSMQPVLWLSVLLICADFATLLGFLPLLRPLAVLLAPLAVGGLMFVQDGASKGEPVSVREMFAALARRSNSLCVIGLYGAAIVAVGYLILLATFHVSLNMSVTAAGVHNFSMSYGGDHGVRGALESLLGASIFAVAIASACFAPALVMLHDMTPHDAMIASLSGAARNWPVTLMYFAAMTVAVLFAPMVPLALRALVLTPVLTAVPLLSIYGAYRDVFIGR